MFKRLDSFFGAVKEVFEIFLAQCVNKHAEIFFKTLLLFFNGFFTLWEEFRLHTAFIVRVTHKANKAFFLHCAEH